MVMVRSESKKDTPIALEIYEAKSRNNRQSRGYLGMSEIGKPCERAIWYSWRKFTPAPMDGRVLVLFELGDHVEQIIARNLRLAGYELWNAYPDQQLSFSDHGGFFSGHCDGVIRLRNLEGAPMAILECKSANKTKFEEMQKHGVEKANPTYFAQMQCYMGYHGLDHAAFMAMNKNDSTIYDEVIRFRKDIFDGLKDRAARVLATHDKDGILIVPDRMVNDKDSFECKWCQYRTHCYEPDEAIQESMMCRSCNHFELLPGKWAPRCRHTMHECDLVDISRSCPDWSFIGSTPF